VDSFGVGLDGCGSRLSVVLLGQGDEWADGMGGGSVAAGSASSASDMSQFGVLDASDDSLAYIPPEYQV